MTVAPKKGEEIDAITILRSQSVISRWILPVLYLRSNGRGSAARRNTKGIPKIGSPFLIENSGKSAVDNFLKELKLHTVEI